MEHGFMSLNPQTARHEWTDFVCNAVELVINCKKNEEHFSTALSGYSRDKK